MIIMKKNKKKCSKCKQHHSLEKFNKSVQSKDGKGSYCKECSAAYQKESRKRKYQVNPALELLKKSCEAAFRRSQPEYVKDGYAHVTTSYMSVKEFWSDLWNDDDFRECWIKQSMIFENSGIYKDRPTLDRIDSMKGYEKVNLQVLPYLKNVTDGASRECEVYVIKDLRLNDKMNYSRIGEAKEDLIRRYHIPINVLNQVDHGSVIDAGNGIGLLIQTIKGELKTDVGYKYQMVWNLSRTIFDIETDEEIITEKTQLQLGVSGIQIKKY